LLCIPRSLIPQLFEGVHKSTMAGHPGLTKMYRTLLLKHYVPSLKQILAYYLKRGDECQRYKSFPDKKQGELLYRPVGNLGEQYIFDTLCPIIS